MGRERGWVSVSVQTYQSHRASTQRILQQEYTVDESGATLNALSRASGSEEEERERAEQQSSATPTTSIFIRDWKVRSRHRLPFPADSACPPRSRLPSLPPPTRLRC